MSYRALQTSDTMLERLSLVIATVLAVIFLKEKLTWQVITGIALMTPGAVIVGLAKKSS